MQSVGGDGGGDGASAESIVDERKLLKSTIGILNCSFVQVLLSVEHRGRQLALLMLRDILVVVYCGDDE